MQRQGYMKRSGGLTRTRLVSRRRALRAKGKKGKAWDKARRALKVEALAEGWAHCERCGASEGLTMAHRVKRRFITTEAELRNVICLCLICHNWMELGTHERMARLFDEIKAKREAA
jgi:cellobiose-specific phosphotransferase system component IIA